MIDRALVPTDEAQFPLMLMFNTAKAKAPRGYAHPITAPFAIVLLEEKAGEDRLVVQQVLQFETRAAAESTWVLREKQFTIATETQFGDAALRAVHARIVLNEKVVAIYLE